MKPYLMLTAILIIGCSKGIPEKPVEPEPISFTQTRVMYDGKKFIGTLAVIHYHRVDDPKLIAQYKAYPKRIAICPEMTDTLVTVIGKACDANCYLTNKN